SARRSVDPRPDAGYPVRAADTMQESWFHSGGSTLAGARNWGQHGDLQRGECVYSTANLFPALGITPAVGRAFTQEEDRPGGAAVALLSYGLWLRRFGGDPNIVGQSLTLEGESHLIIGVTPAGFQLSRGAELLLPLRLDAE